MAGYGSTFGKYRPNVIAEAGNQQAANIAQALTNAVKIKYAQDLSQAEKEEAERKEEQLKQEEAKNADEQFNRAIDLKMAELGITVPKVEQERIYKQELANKYVTEKGLTPEQAEEQAKLAPTMLEDASSFAAKKLNEFETLDDEFTLKNFETQEEADLFRSQVEAKEREADKAVEEAAEVNEHVTGIAGLLSKSPTKLELYGQAVAESRENAAKAKASEQQAQRDFEIFKAQLNQKGTEITPKEVRDLEVQVYKLANLNSPKFAHLDLKHPDLTTRYYNLLQASSIAKDMENDRQTALAEKKDARATFKLGLDVQTKYDRAVGKSIERINNSVKAQDLYPRAKAGDLHAQAGFQRSIAMLYNTGALSDKDVASIVGDSLWSRIKKNFDSGTDGDNVMLTPTQIESLKKTAEGIYNRETEYKSRIDDQWKDIADEGGVNLRITEPLKYEAKSKKVSADQWNKGS